MSQKLYDGYEIPESRYSDDHHFEVFSRKNSVWFTTFSFVSNNSSNYEQLND